jgi:NAD(P)-dependent dehydrogenase (short-subunit alcohol dehydrogenase family)
MGECEGKVALVTGASRGIGKALSRRLAAEGAAVVVSASRLGEHRGLVGSLEQTVAEIVAAGGTAVAVAADLSSETARVDLVARSEAALGPLDILVNNAAAGTWAFPSACSLKDRRMMLEVNFHAPVDLMQQVLPGMRKRGRGWILNIGSNASEQPVVPYRSTPEMAHVIVPYGSSKLPLNRYTEGLAHELWPDGIHVNSLAPVSIVLTQEAAQFVGHIAKENPDMTEPIEVIVEAAVDLVSGMHTGLVVYSRSFLHSICRPVRSIDGKTVVGDAFMPADLASVVA